MVDKIDTLIASDKADKISKGHAKIAQGYADLAKLVNRMEKAMRYQTEMFEGKHDGKLRVHK
tara:strand:+ start:404 stop:589 length:186 start_codon:yes stop_codon:yes gene_type:complete